MKIILIYEGQYESNVSIFFFQIQHYRKLCISLVEQMKSLIFQEGVVLESVTSTMHKQCHHT
jgi:hypothetical protein